MGKHVCDFEKKIQTFINSCLRRILRIRWPETIYSILGCDLTLLEVAVRQSLPSFSVLCYPCPYRSLLPHNVISPTTFWSSNFHLLSFIPSIIFRPVLFHFVLVTYWTMSVALFFCLMMALRILSLSLPLSIFIPNARWLVSSVLLMLL